ncbi:unnamed protein product [Clonostachys solani]|uniref:Uncharacterized protein n=1 Tax=Clonostachys solani TaxID=160281 RepID=A0A9N9ZP84_9HYPO|nr:unnamed protein product [Clonostachys solani]
MNLLALMVLLAVACPASAIWTEDASNNFATDLAPFLALFGEKMLLHWLSQSVTYFEVFVIAVCPIGVPALIMGAIRLAGSQTTRNFIGRPRESRPVVESELTPSTSNEVSESWDGQRVVRTIGEGKTQEYFVLKRVGATSTDRIVAKKLSESVGTYIEVGDVPTLPGKSYQILKSTFNSLTRCLASMNLPSLGLNSVISFYTGRSRSASDVEHNTVSLHDVTPRAPGNSHIPHDDAGVILIKNDKNKSPNLSLNIQEHFYPKRGTLMAFLALAGFFLGLICPWMDWLSMIMAKGLQDAPWSKRLEANEESDSSDRPWAANGGWDWKAPSWEDLQKCLPLLPDAPLDPNARLSKAQEVLNLRKGIAGAGAIPPPLTTLAVSVARAIEGTLNTLTDSGEGYLEHGCRSLLWKIGGHPDDVVEIRLNLDADGKWKVPAGDLEAILSLWLFKTSCGGKARGRQPAAEAVPVGESISTGAPAGHASVGQEDEWLRKYSQKSPSLLPMPSEGNPLPALSQEINLWFNEPFRDTRQFGLVALKHGIHSSEPSQRRSSTSPAQSSYRRPSESSSSSLPDEDFGTLGEVKTLVEEPEGSLQTSHAQHLFCLFMWSLAKTLKKPIGGDTNVVAAPGRAPSKGLRQTRFAVENSHLREISSKISLAGLGEQGIVFPALLLPLLAANKLPSARAILKAAREYHDAYERKEPQDTDFSVYIWLFGNLLKLPSQKELFITVASVLIDGLEHMHLDHEPDWKAGPIITGTLTSVIKITRSYLGDPGWKVIKRMVSVSESHDTHFSSTFNSTSGQLGLEPISEHSGNTPNPVSPHNHLTPLQLFCFNGEDLSEEKITEVIKHNLDDIDAVDIFGRTAIHYAIQRDHSRRFKLVRRLCDFGAKLNIPDLLGRTPLHIACHCPEVAVVDKLLSSLVEGFNVSDSKGLTPLHHAVAWGRGGVLDYLRELGRTSLFRLNDRAPELVHYYARYREARDLTSMTGFGVMGLCDHRGRSGFHLVVINHKIKPEDIPTIFTEITHFDYRDSASESPLDLAARILAYGCGHDCSRACKERMEKIHPALIKQQSNLLWLRRPWPKMTL